MCGIAILLSSSPSNFIDAMPDLTAAIRHRGPDDEGFSVLSNTGELRCWGGKDTPLESLTNQLPYTPLDRFVPRAGLLSFGHRRLSILDLTPSGHQPLCSEDGRYWITFNGEIYNYRELRRELESKGYRFRSNTDTETILAAYGYWGKDMLKRLVGMFSFAILDQNEKTLFVARDFFGIKPLYYWQGEDGVAFASEPKALLRLPQVSRAVNPQRLYNYLQNGITDFEGETMFRDIRQLPAAHYIEIDLKGSVPKIEVHRYWSVEDSIDQEARHLSFDQAAEKLRHLFLESISLHLRSDVPVGAALSGGIDSSAIFMAMRHLQGPNLELHAFSFIPSENSISEEKWIDLVSAAAKAKSHKVKPSADELLKDIDHLVACQDEPFGSTSIYAQHRVFRLAHENGIKVMLDGQGADEMFAGYLPYYGSRVASLVRSGSFIEAIRFSKVINKNPQAGLKQGFFYFGKSVLPKFLHRSARKMIGKPFVADWMNGDWFASKNVRTEGWPQPAGRHVLKSTLREQLTTTSVPALLRYEDRNSMAYSIESRVPFLTPKLVGFAYGLPEDYLIDRNGTTKAVFRAAMRGIVPDPILNRRDKIGFNTPEKLWLTQLNPWMEKVLSSETARKMPAWNFDKVQADWKAMNNGTIPFDFRAWRWVNLVRWAEINEVQF